MERKWLLTNEKEKEDKNMKKQYIQPTMKVELIEMETQLLAGSLPIFDETDDFLEDETDFLSKSRFPLNKLF